MAIQSNFPSVRPSLLLDFASVKQLDPRITFTRASTATYYNGVTTAKAEENLMTYSQEFDNAAWTKYLMSVTANATTAPDGTTTAELIAETTANNIHLMENYTSIVSGQVYTFAVFLKKGTGATAPDIMQVTYGGQGFGVSVYANFNLNTGTVTATGAGASSSSIVSVGNGWYRCIFTATATGTGGGGLGISFTNNNSSATRAPSYTGATTADAFVWGAQVEQRSAVTAYTATTTQAITNYIPALQSAASGVARFDHNPTTGESLGLLIEESRANLLTYSGDFGNAAWGKSNSSIDSNTIVAPDGTLTGDKLVENTATNSHYTSQSQAISSGASYTVSIYAKAAERTQIQLQFYDGTTNKSPIFSLVDGTKVTDGGIGTAWTSTSVGNGWWRFSITATSATTTGYVYIYPASGGTAVYTGNGFSGIYIWGVQMEAGAFATSYIPTVASQVTRAADAASMTGTNFSAWYSADQGTIYSEFNRTFADTSNSGQFVMISDGSATNRLFMQYSASSNFGTFEIIVGGTTQASINSAAMTIGSYHKMGAAYKVNDIASSVDGATVGTDTSATIPVVNQMSIGNRGYTSAGFLNGTIKKLAYYPMRVTNAQLQALTS